MTKEQKELERILIDFIKEEVQDREQITQKECIPATAHELIELWKLDQY